MEQVKISIIVPVYNTGEFLYSCIDSIRRQTLTEWELLLIDDGSSDNSGEICDKYAEIDRRIRVIHKKNGGVSAARNTGLAQASGEFIGFVDSDDMIEPDMYERMYNEAKKTESDIVMCDAVTVYKDGREDEDTITQLSSSCTIEKPGILPTLLVELAGSSCRCIYRNALIQRHSEFPVAQKFSEDRVFNIYMMGYANRISYIKESFYRRLMWEGSAVHRFHEDHFEAVKAAVIGTDKALCDAWDAKAEYRIAYLQQFIQGAIASINNYFYKTCKWSFSERWNAVKRLCCDEDLRLVIEKSNYNDIRTKWILKKRVLLLCLCAKILNFKHKR